MNDLGDLHRILGELSADMKHVIKAIGESRDNTESLRREMKKEHDELKARLLKVEKFNVRVLTYASVAIPVILASMKWAVPAILALL